MAYSQVPSYQTFATQIPEVRKAGNEVLVGQRISTQSDISSIGAVAAAGSAQGDAGILPNAALVNVSAADDAKGVILPVDALPGTTITITSTVASKVLKVYPHVGGKINYGSENASVSMAAQGTQAFKRATATDWVTTTGAIT